MLIRSAAALAAVTLAVSLAACGAKQDLVTSAPMRTVTLMLDFPANADHLGIYTAELKDEFKQVGIDLQIKTPQTPSEPLTALTTGKADLAISYEPELLIARDKGASIMSVGAIVQRPLTSLISTDDKSVDPRKLEGAKIGTAGIPYQDAFLDQLLSSAGVDTSSIKRSDVGFKLVSSMTSGRVDATLGGYWNIEAVELRLRNKHPRVMPVDRAGIPPYDELVLVARNDTVSRDGAMIRRFIGALMRGTEAAKADPAIAVGALRAAAPKLNKRFAAASVKATLPVLFPSARKPFGWQDQRQWQSFADWMTRNELLKAPADTAQALTNEFLPGEGLGSESSP